MPVPTSTAAAQDHPASARTDPNGDDAPPGTPQPPKLNGLTVDQATQQVHAALRSLLSEEFPDLTRLRSNRVNSMGEQYLQLSFTSIKNCFKAISRAWIGVVFSFGWMLMGGISFIDFFAAWCFSLSITIILTAGVIICIFAKFPLVGRAFDAYAGRHGGVSFINIVNSGMFKNLSGEELELAKKGMSSTDAPEANVLNIDIAKLMLLFAAIVYERSNEPKRDAIRRLSSMDWPNLVQRPNDTPLPPNDQHGLFRSHSAPTDLDDMSPLQGTGPRPFQSMDSPSTTGKQRRSTTLSAEFITWQREFISQSPFSSPVFPTDPRQPLISSDPGGGRSQGNTGSGSGDAPTAQDSGVISDTMTRWGFEYEPVSELDTASSAYTAMFWDKTSNWVTIAFKGTSPPEFDEWLIDFDYTRVPVADFIPRFGHVHRGFKNRLFPQEPLNRTPYETIVLALKTVTDDLLSRTTGVVNVYFTGHSLGSGIASLAYGRMVQNVDGLNPRVRIRDAYLFSAPIASDMDTAKLFNKDIVSGPYGPCTTWRITNHHDAVATLFPAMGDDPRYPYPESLFAYAHLGTEVKMRRKGTQSIVENDYASPSATATAVSGLPEDKIGVVPKGMDAPLWMEAAQYIPLAGWMFSHFPGLYFAELQGMGSGEMKWIRKRPAN